MEVFFRSSTRGGRRADARRTSALYLSQQSAAVSEVPQRLVGRHHALDARIGRVRLQHEKTRLFELLDPLAYGVRMTQLLSGQELANGVRLTALPSLDDID